MQIADLEAQLLQALHAARHGDSRELVSPLLPVRENVLLHDLTRHIARCLTAECTRTKDGVEAQLSRAHRPVMTCDNGIALLEIGFNAQAARLLQYDGIFMQILNGYYLPIAFFGGGEQDFKREVAVCLSLMCNDIGLRRLCLIILR